MEVHLIADPDTPSDLLNRVCKILNDQGTSIRFIPAKQFTKSQLEKLLVSLPTESETVSFDQLFSLCAFYRAAIDLDDSVFVVLVTSYNNEYYWFSAVKDNDIFVIATDWDQITEKDKSYCIAYQVIENIFQSILKVNYYNIAENSKYIHAESIGCINDFCEKKSEIMLKLKTADICSDCIERAKELNTSTQLLNDIQRIIEKVRMEIKSLRTGERVEPQIIQIGKRGEIKIGNKEIRLEPLHKTLLIFYLTKGPVSVTGLSDFEKPLLDIYHKIRPSGNPDSVKKLSLPYFNKDSTFLKTKSALNKSLLIQLGEPLADYYTVNKDSEDRYLVNLAPNYLDVRPEF